MTNSLPINIGLASIWAGGGHNELRDFLFEELKKNEGFNLKSFTHTNASYNWFNDYVFGNLPTYLNFLYKHAPNDYPGISAINLVKECESFVNEFNPDIMISSNFGVCSAFQFIKKTLGLSFVNIYAIPDYGHTGKSIFPQNPYFKPDYVIVFDIETKKGLIDDMGFPAEKVIISGSIARESFRKLIEDNKTTEKESLIKSINKEISDCPPLSSEKGTYIFSGGSGGVINKSFKLLKKIAEYQDQDPEIIEKKQYVIITGQNSKFKDKINKLKKRYSNWSNFYPLPWIKQETYAKLMLISDFPILITIAPATINQLMTAECGPLVIYHYRTGPELENVAFSIKEGIGIKLQDPEEIIDKIVNGFTSEEELAFKQNARDYLYLREELLKDLAPTITMIYRKEIEGLKERKKPTGMKINYDLISPKVLLTLFVLLIPSSLIFAYAQYFKGKNKFLNNQIVQKIIELARS